MAYLKFISWGLVQNDLFGECISKICLLIYVDFTPKLVVAWSNLTINHQLCSWFSDWLLSLSLSVCEGLHTKFTSDLYSWPVDSGMHCQHFQKIGLTALMRMIVKYVKRTHIWSLRKPLSSGVFTSIHRLGFQPSRTSCKNAIASLKLTLTANAPEKKGMAGMLRL